ncbi:ent-kaurene synthase, chloroplastic isoform X3 [Mangifera indica]|uniref:ent-kaurene synthase, chloroplastic isoform X3 n=1 Tax=Mangifera indica TaxID=29780 RepID=UPI001CFA981E|nr:ent-kaurene synthase, chloroplastic isoform X3 [Mangifera indica]
MAFGHTHSLTISSSSLSAGAAKTRSKFITDAKTTSLLNGTKERIKKIFYNTDLSVSSYDTAWVAMVPSPDTLQSPCFPQCINWLLDNQLQDGSWGLPQRPSWLVKDALSCTLASVLALKRWGIGEEQMSKGIKFIESNFDSINDEKQHTPIGFDIIFPGMLECAKDLNLNLPLKAAEIDALVHRRHSEVRRIYLEGRKEYLAYVSEGMGKLQDWEMVMKYQRKNGSLFNSPSATAAALSHLQVAGCLEYLRSVLEKFGDAVPTFYPFDLYARLFLVESLQSLGIDHHFKNEIRGVMDETYRYWLQGEGEILLDPATCAMAFRLLRFNGYDISSDPLAKFTEDQFFNSLGGCLKGIRAVLELYKASQVIIYPDEFLLEKQNLWSRQFLEQELSRGSIHSDRLGKQFSKQVEYQLKFPYHSQLERLAHRRNTENYSVDDISILKTSYRFLNISNEYIQQLAVDDFNICQSIHQEELKNLERWVAQYRLDKLKFARQKLPYCYFSGAATLFSPELSDARISWAKNGVLTTVVDDFFDVGGSIDELENLVQLVKKWNVEEGMDYCSEAVKIIFSAIHSYICEVGEKAFMWQGRDVTSHVVEIWLNLLKSMLKEAEWCRNKSVPSLDEYMENAYVSFALGPIVLPAVYLVGPKLPEESVKHPEIHNLYKLMSTSGRLLNDIRGFKRESKQGKLNAVSLHMINSDITEEEAMQKLRSLIDSNRRELLRLVLQEKGSIIPRAVKDLFWKMSKVLHLFYMKNDGFTSQDMFNFVNDVVQEPVSVEKL